MPTVTQRVVDGFIACVDPRCPGYKQKPTQVTLEYVAFTYGDNGGDGTIPLAAIEREAVRTVQTDEPCEICGKPTIRSVQERPEYAQVSGQDQLALLNLNQSGQIRDQQMAQLKADKDLAEMKALLFQQRAEMDQLQVELQRRKGGRPPKTETDQ